MKTGYIVLAFVILFILAIKLLTPDRALQPVLINNIDTSPEKQSVRKRLIDQYKNTGLIDRIDTSGAAPSVYVGQLFYPLKKHEKETVMSTVSDYYYVLNKKSSMVIIKDAVTKEKIGKYSQNGLSIRKR